MGCCNECGLLVGGERKEKGRAREFASFYARDAVPMDQYSNENKTAHVVHKDSHVRHGLPVIRLCLKISAAELPASPFQTPAAR